MRVEYNGHWAEVSEEPLTWGLRNRLRSAATKDFWEVFAPAVVTALVTAWSEAGSPKEASSWEPVDPDFADKVFAAAINVYKTKADEAEADPTPGPSASS